MMIGVSYHTDLFRLDVDRITDPFTCVIRTLVPSASAGRMRRRFRSDTCCISGGTRPTGRRGIPAEKRRRLPRGGGVVFLAEGVVCCLRT